MSTEHRYAARVIWEGAAGEGTAAYTSYDRRYRVLVAGKADLEGSADPAFRGDAELHNPEDLFLASLSACHMLTYLALCARSGVLVEGYRDDAAGVLRMDPGGGGRFEEIVLNPTVTVAGEEQAARAVALHEKAHRLCFIAASCRVEIRIRPSVQVGSPDRAEAECA